MSRAMWDSDGVTSSVTRSVTSGDVIIGDVTIHLSHLAVVGIQRMNEEKEEGMNEGRKEGRKEGGKEGRKKKGRNERKEEVRERG